MSEERNLSLDVGKKLYEVSDDVQAVAKKVVTDKNMELEPAVIKYVKVYPNISKKVAGRCILSSAMIKLFGDCDYIIQVSGGLWDELDENRKEILMYHELLHVKPVFGEKSGEWRMTLRDHDIQDFYVIIKQHGIEWFNELKTLNASVYELTDSEGFTI